MAEPRRLESTPSLDPAELARRIDTLLVEGLDHYFASRYDEAIHLWTRVLFLDRGDVRARAYIERARTALAERQRRADELLHTSRRLLDAGDTALARDLLAQAVATTGDDERAAEMRQRLDRVERASRPWTAREGDRLRRSGSASPAQVAGPDAEWPLITAVAAIAVLVVVASAPGLQSFFGVGPTPAPLAQATPTAAFRAPATSEVALIRARTAFGRGRLAEALRALDRVDVQSPARAQADALRVSIQQLLLASGQGAAPGAREPEAGRP
jgi:hypothetical protein